MASSSPLTAIGERLGVGRCSCETGRQRHRIPPGTRIAYEVLADSPQAVAVAASVPTTGAVLVVVPPTVVAISNLTTGASQAGDDLDSSSTPDVVPQSNDSDIGDEEYSDNGLIQSLSEPLQLLLDTHSPSPVPEAGAGPNDDIINEIQSVLGGGNGQENVVSGNALLPSIIGGGGFAASPDTFQLLPLLNPSLPNTNNSLINNNNNDINNNTTWPLFDDDDGESDPGEGSLLDTDSEAPDSASEHDGEPVPPRIATWRLNLTALSQVHNLYFTAYRDQIHVSRPRSCVTSHLPPVADLVLKPGASPAGIAVGGSVDDLFPHQVNHLIIGDLGNEEILVMAYDDGDVIAFYTRHIKDAVRQRQTIRDPSSVTISPQPFFHENVGKSAWGLAIHSQSRLIAVGSNARKVEVFAFALTGLPCASMSPNLASEPPELFRRVCWDAQRTIIQTEGFLAHLIDPSHPDTYIYLAAVEASMARRDANWHMTFDTGSAGHNIPNVTFSSTQNGDADKAVAVDVKGNVWLIDLWSTDSGPYTKIESIRRRQAPRYLAFREDVRPRGWGVLVLPESSFLPTSRTFPDLIGIKESQAKYAYNEKIGRFIDISAGAERVENSSRQHPWLRNDEEHRFAFNQHDRGDQAYVRPWFDFQGQGWPASPVGLASPPPGALTPASVRSLSSPKGRASPSRRTSAKHDSSGGGGGGGGSSLRGSDQYSFSYRHSSRAKPVLADGSSIMRTYELDIELRSHIRDDYGGGVGIMFEDAIRQTRPPGAFVPSMRVSHERLSNLLHIPELHLVVAASMCGRVALITLTRPTSARDTADGSRQGGYGYSSPSPSSPSPSMRPTTPLSTPRKGSGQRTASGVGLGTGGGMMTEDVPFARGFKIEAILPTKEDEDRRLRPMCPLLGVAASPLPSDDVRRHHLGNGGGGGGGGSPNGGRRRRTYRLMLQYYDLRILSYEISRGVGDDLAIL